MLSTLRSLLHRRLPANPQISRVTVSLFSSSSNGSNNNDNNNSNSSWSTDWGGDWGGTDSLSSWSTGLTKDHFDGYDSPIGVPVSNPESQSTIPNPQPQTTARQTAAAMDEEDDLVRMLEADNRESRKALDSWDVKMMDTYKLMKQVREPGVRGEYLKDSEKKEMYRLYKEDPEVNSVEKLAKEFRVMRQRVHSILWLKEMEEEEEKRAGKPLDDSVEILLDNFPEFFISHDREFHVSSLPYKPEFKVMPEGWDGTTRDPDEVHYEISMKAEERLYEEFVQRLNFNKMKVAGEVKKHPYSRRRPDEGWNFTVEKLGSRDKRGGGGGWKFVSLPDGSSRPLNDKEKIYVKRETPKRRKRMLPPFKH